MLSNARRLDDMDATPADSGNPNSIIITDQLEHLNTTAMAIVQDAANSTGLDPDNAAQQATQPALSQATQQMLDPSAPSRRVGCQISSRQMLACPPGQELPRRPDGHPKLLHLWPVKLLQAGRTDYDGSDVMAMRAAASLSR